MTVRFLLVVVSVSMLGFAPAPLPKNQRQREGPVDLTGTWAFTRIEYNGVLEQTDISHFRVKMTPDRIVFDTWSHSEWTMTLDPSASPPSFTWGQGKQIILAGSYQYRNGELTMIFANASRLQDRATNFDKAPHKYVFRRVSR